MPPRTENYALTPAFRHPEARKVTNKRKEREPKVYGTDLALANVPKTERPSRALVAAYSGLNAKKLSEGAFGKTYLVDADTKFADFARIVARDAAHRVTNEVPRDGDHLVIKSAKYSEEEYGSFRKFVMDNVKEAAVHKLLSTDDLRTCIKIPCAEDAFECPSRYVPKFYFSFALGDTYITVMSKAGTMTLEQYMKRHRMTAVVYASIERAVAVMWAAGFAHADLHSNNMLIDPTTDRVTILDFGFAVKIPEAMRTSIRKDIGDMVAGGEGSIGELWTKGGARSLAAYADRVLHTRGFPWYNPNGRAILLLFNKMSKVERLAMPGVRRRLWNCPTPATVDSRPIDFGSDTTEEGEIRPRRVRKQPVPRRVPAAAVRVPAAAVRAPTPAAAVVAPNGTKFGACRAKCEARGKFCNPKTYRCVKNRPADESQTPANLSAMAKRLKRPPAQNKLKQILVERRAKCAEQGKVYNPETGRCKKVR